ncbi:MAG: M1 family metallopeptidase [Bacteroidales bacterium]|nr:M1 family metallopeptidase [Bacteroidales bacterium]MBN2758703.1 M1 family metallopeptidase [Bacteroidales bacterium]
MKKGVLLLSLFYYFFQSAIISQELNDNQFRQLGTLLPDANCYRTASGAPGNQYWQQKADYQIKVVLDENKNTISGEETITYINNSPDNLSYLWVQLDQNLRAKDSFRLETSTNQIDEKMSASALRFIKYEFDGGFKIDFVKDSKNADLKYVINKTMMRIDLPEILKSGEKFTFKIKWWYNINDRDVIWGRSGMEYFPKDDNYLYTIAQFYPRMVLYSDYQGWQNKQFLGRGEFTLTFGDFDVEITVPADHILSATGELQNMTEVLTNEQIESFNKAKTSAKPVIIVSQKEVEKKEKQHLKNTKTWKFKAINVRDFAFATSRKFIWDAMGVKFGDRTVMAMSFYPKEGNPLWEKYSTQAVAHTIKTYSKFTFDFPYPVAQSIHSKWIGMEYPMICFNGGRPDEDGTYSKRTKYSMLGVIIHEVGHNFFPMIVNSDERQWTWMDEGLNTFLQYNTEQAWEKNFPSRNGSPELIVDYMKSDKSELSPIMTNADIVLQSHDSQYGKPAAALRILRETVMGRELFDFAFKEYANRWKFKHPTPADFFRTLEDASGVDLDWFWRGWFYSNDNVDISIDKVQFFKLSDGNPVKDKAFNQKMIDNNPKTIQSVRDENTQTVIEKNTELKDFYNSYNENNVEPEDNQLFKSFTATLTDEEKKFINANDIYVQIDFSNKGGLVMPLILKFTYTDGTSEIIRIPAEIWRNNNKKISKVFVKNKQIAEIVFDPHQETADVDVSNNFWPTKQIESRFDLFKQKMREQKNPMQKKK